MKHNRELSWQVSWAIKEWSYAFTITASTSQHPHTSASFLWCVSSFSLLRAEFLEEKSGPVSLYDQYGFKTTLIYFSVSRTLEIHPCVSLLMNIKPLQGNQRNFTFSHVKFHPTRDMNELVFGRGEDALLLL